MKKKFIIIISPEIRFVHEKGNLRRRKKIESISWGKKGEAFATHKKKSLKWKSDLDFLNIKTMVETLLECVMWKTKTKGKKNLKWMIKKGEKRMYEDQVNNNYKTLFVLNEKLLLYLRLSLFIFGINNFYILNSRTIIV